MSPNSKRADSIRDGYGRPVYLHAETCVGIFGQERAQALAEALMHDAELDAAEGASET